jgi:hypothetical protein
MNFEIAYLVVIALLGLTGIFYISPYELKVDEEEDNE